MYRVKCIRIAFGDGRPDMNARWNAEFDDLEKVFDWMLVDIRQTIHGLGNVSSSKYIITNT